MRSLCRTRTRTRRRRTSSRPSSLLGSTTYPIPRTTVVSTVEQAREAAGVTRLACRPEAEGVEQFRPGNDVVEHHEVTYAEDRASLDAQVARVEGRYEILLQEYHRGEAHGVELLLYRGRPLAAFQHRRLHEVPITGGASSLRESVPLDPDALRSTRRGCWPRSSGPVSRWSSSRSGRTARSSWRSTGGSGARSRSPSRAASTFPRGWPSSTSRADRRTDGRPTRPTELGVRSRNLDLEVVWIASTLRGRQGRRLVLVPRAPRGRRGGHATPESEGRVRHSLLGRSSAGLGRDRRDRRQASSEGSIVSGTGLRPSLCSRCYAEQGFELFVATLERVLPARTGEFAVLTYHRRRRSGAFAAAATPASSPALPSLRLRWTFLASRYRPVSLTELLGARRGEHALPLRSVLVTFDDGYRDFSDHAWPILRRHGIPTVLFVPTAYPGNPGRAFWWDRLYSAVSRTSAAETVDTPVRRASLGVGVRPPGHVPTASEHGEIVASRGGNDARGRDLRDRSRLLRPDPRCSAGRSSAASSRRASTWRLTLELTHSSTRCRSRRRAPRSSDRSRISSARSGSGHAFLPTRPAERAPRSRAFSKRRGSSSRSRRSEGRTTSALPTGCGFGASMWGEHPRCRSCARSFCPGGTDPTREGRFTDTKHAWTDKQRFEIDKLRARGRVRASRPAQLADKPRLCGKGE